jgi:hypothetical protein
MNLGAATYVRRNLVDRVVRTLCVVGTVIALIPLASVQSRWVRRVAVWATR